MSAALQSEALEKALAGLRLGYPAHWHPQIGSTNDEAKRLAEDGAPEGLLVLADSQTAGRGRSGRRWVTASGTALAFSLVLRPQIPPARTSLLTMLAGVAVCEAIEQEAGVPATLKWPNDVMLGDKKTGGVLLEAALEGGRLAYAVLGVGLNVSAPPPPLEVDYPATAVQDEARRSVDRLALLRAILQHMQRSYHDGQLPEDALYQDWRGRLAWVGEAGVVETPRSALRGRLAGADRDGSLLIRLDTGEVERVSAGSLRRVDGKGG